jgi:uncharacterized oxidoreductase
MKDLQTLLIVGATSGIGEELARQYHVQGKRVIISGHQTAKLQALTAELPGLCLSRYVYNTDHRR